MLALACQLLFKPIFATQHQLFSYSKRGCIADSIVFDLFGNLTGHRAQSRKFQMSPQSGCDELLSERKSELQGYASPDHVCMVAYIQHAAVCGVLRCCRDCLPQLVRPQNPVQLLNVQPGRQSVIKVLPHTVSCHEVAPYV